VGLERGPLSLLSIIEELLERKSSSFGLEIRDCGCNGSAALTTRHPYIRKSWHESCLQAAVTLGVICLWTQTTDFAYLQSREFICDISSSANSLVMFLVIKLRLTE
jgi:hypothetical protein